ncbi:Phage tail tape measure protein [uncultured Caudovirales phage]|uniref:Phage tail tape measure protein n=1 Tax=uncultured Caudovirales phage TaxID=2100421 RepID=A0A6J5QMU7_9CAUD|nr:Phage tail tape measure protein [uncultured Caudovirales phage]CAB4193490.1 Phage tail tape measure protein [uncultured Caudovirales phage]
MARIELNIVALGDFSSVNNQIKALQVQIANLNKGLAGVGAGPGLVKDLNAINASFKSALLSSGQFTATTVKMANETDKFGKSLVTGKLRLSEYFGIITGKSAAATSSLRALAAEQVKLQNSIVASDPTKRGMFTVFTPTQIDKVANATKLATMQQNLYNVALDGSSKALINWGKNTQWAGRQLTVGLTMPMVLFGSSAAKIFQEVNDQLTRLQKVYGEGLKAPTKEALADIRSQTVGLAKDLASTMGVAAKDTAAMAADLAATGLQGKDLLEGTREAMRLAKLGELDQQQAMLATVSLQNVYKLSTQDLTKSIDFLNAVENQTSTSLQDLVDGIPRVGPIVAQLGGSFKDTAVMMVAMKEAGVPAAQAANAIKSGLASLINPTKRASEMFAEYNINLGAISTSAKGNPIEMIMGLQKALVGLDPLTQARLIEQLFGKFQQARMQALITNLGAVNSQTKTAFDLAGASAPALAAIAASEMKIATESTTGKFKRAVETLKADLIPVGEKILEVATKVIEFADKIASAFGALPGPVQSFIGIFAGGAAIAGPIIMLTGLMGNFAGYILKAIYNLRNLASGGMTFKQLLTPELIASSNAATLFGSSIQNDVNAVNLLNGAIERLTVSMNAMVSAMGASAGGLGAATRAAGAAGALKIPFSSPPKKMATGGLVPGPAGAGDIIPALLSPGESVVTRSATQKYGPIINQMNNGTLPGFEEGVYDLAHFGRNLGPGDEAFDKFISANPGYADLAKSGKLTVMSKLTGALAHDINKQLDAGSASLEAYRRAYQESGPLKFAHSAVAGGLSLEDLKNPEIKAASDQFEKSLLSRVESLGKTVISDQDVYKVTRELIDETKTAPGAMGRFVGSLDDASRQFGGFRVKLNAAELRAGIESGEITKVASTKSKYAHETGMLYMGGSAVGQYGGSSGEGSVRGFSRNKYRFTGAVSKGIDSIKASWRNGMGIRSDSTVMADEVGQHITGGVAKGMEDNTPRLIKTGEQQMEQVADAQQKRSRLINKRMAIGSSVGIAGMIGGSMVSGIGGGNNPVANTAGGILSNIGSLGMLASFIPRLAAVFPQLAIGVGVATLAFKGLSYQIEKNREHNKQVEASLRSSSDVISMFGGKLNVASQAMYSFDVASGKTEKELTKIQKAMAGIKALDKDNPLKLVSESLKGMNTSSSIVGTLKTFASAQVASGMDPAGVKDMVEAILAYAGKSQYLVQVQKEVAKATKDASTATGVWLQKVYQANTVSISAGSTYSDLSGKQRALADAILQVTNTISSSSTSFSQFTDSLKIMASDSMNTTTSINALSSALANADQLGASLQVAQFGKLGMNMPEIQLLLKMSAGGMAIKAKGKTPEEKAKYLKDEYLTQKNIDKVFTDQLKSSELAAKQQLDAAKAAKANLTAQTAGDSSKIKSLQAQKNLLDAQLKSLKQQTDEMSKQQQFNISQAELRNKQRAAQASGNFLEASLIQQQMLAGQQEFQSDKSVSALEGKSSALGEQIAALKQAAQDAKTATANAAAIKQADAAIAGAKLAYDQARAAANDKGTITAMVASILAALGIKPPTSTKGDSRYSETPLPSNISGVPTFANDAAAKKALAGGVKTSRVTGKNTATGMDVQYQLVYDKAQSQYYWVNSMSGVRFPAVKEVKPRAKGGPTFKDQMYLVGEKGPEFFVPSQNGNVLSNDVSRSMMNQSSNTTNEYALNLTFNGANMDPDDVARTVMDAIKRAGKSNSVYTNRRIET